MEMWVLVQVLAVSVLLPRSQALPLPPALPNDLDLEAVSDILSQLEQIPEDEEVTPELEELYHDVEMLYEIQKSNVSETREGRGFLSKLSFLTGLKLGSFLTSSGTLAASQSVNFLGKVLNAALSVSYGNIGGYQGIYPEGGVPGVAGGEGLQKLPIIQEDVPPDDKKREKPEDPRPPAVRVKTPESVRKEFIDSHNNRVEHFNNAFDNKISKSTSRTGREENSNQKT